MANFNEVMNGKQLKEFNDDIGDELVNYRSRDYNDRDACFIDINGEIFVSEKDQTHAQLVNSYLESIEKESLKNTFTRPSKNQMNGVADTFGFGEIDNNVWFIEDDSMYNNLSTAEILEDIKNSPYNPDKIYISNDDDRLKRVAGRLMKKADCRMFHIVEKT